MAAVDQHTERDALGAAEVEEAVHGGADGAAGVQDVIDEDEVHLVDSEANVRGLQNGVSCNLREVIAVKSNVQSAYGDVDAVDAAHGLGDALGQRHAAAADTDQREMLGATAFLDDLMGEAAQGAVDL